MLNAQYQSNFLTKVSVCLYTHIHVCTHTIYADLGHMANYVYENKIQIKI